VTSDLFAHFEAKDRRKRPRERLALAGEIAPRAIKGLVRPLAHRCFRCGCFTPLGVKMKNAAETVWARRDRIGALQ
jgi:hypothetical protein